MSGSFRAGPLARLLVRMGLHHHRPDPDLSALLAFPSCRCGQLLWPQSGPATDPGDARPVASEDDRPRLLGDDRS